MAGLTVTLTGCYCSSSPLWSCCCKPLPARPATQTRRYACAFPPFKNPLRNGRSARATLRWHQGNRKVAHRRFRRTWAYVCVVGADHFSVCSATVSVVQYTQNRCEGSALAHFLLGAGYRLRALHASLRSTRRRFGTMKSGACARKNSSSRTPHVTA